MSPHWMKRVAVAVGLLASVVALATDAGHWRRDYFPNPVLTTHEGKRVRFYDDLIKDKVVAISFIFTRCKGPCPAETANLRRVQKLLGDRMGREVHLYSITLDPAHDGPRALKQYARKFGVGPGWTFLTGSKKDIDLIRSKLGVYSAEDAKRRKKEKLEEHSISFVVGNEATGRWIKRSAFDEPVVLAQLLGVSLQNLPVRRAAEKKYSDAAEIPRMTAGAELFRNRCATCHALGGGSQDLGPDLAGVIKRRDRNWLARWIREPDRVIAEGDPIARDLLKSYRNVQMPNLKLSKSEVDSILDFLELADNGEK